ncbi:MAG: hypothetical protein J6K21_03720 [Bacilli bacterium]|nr:hypothetical protein [Bacilli bacterium]
MKKRRLKIWPIVLLVVFIILVICLISVISTLKSSKKINTEKIDTIEKYNYNLKQNENLYYKELFKELKKELSKEKIDEIQYASIISKMFLTDFLSLNQALNGNDIGGTEFIHSNYRDTFIKKSKDTIYSYIESNIYGERKQELPEVKEVKVNDIKTSRYSGEKENDDKAYYVECEISYKKNLGYQNNVSLILIHNNDKLEIVSIK